MAARRVPVLRPRRFRAWQWVLGIAALVAAGAVGYLIWSAWGSDAFLAWKREASPVAFFVAMALLPALGFPLVPFYVAAGTTFGVRLGLIGSAIAIAANLSLCYVIARSGLRRQLRAVLRRFGRRIPDVGAKRSPLQITLLIKFAPGIPATIKHYLIALAGVPFPLYFAICMLFAAAYAVPLIVLGESLLEHDVVAVVSAATAAAVLAAGGWWWHARRRRRSSGFDAAHAPPT